MVIRSIIVDDEKHSRGNLAGILEAYCPETEVVGSATSVSAASANVIILSSSMGKGCLFE